MKMILLAVAMTFVASEASAISRYQTMRMSCDQVQATLYDEGAAILRWRSTRDSSLPIYGKYVSDRRFCELGEVTTFATVPTADDRSCNVKKCVRPDNERWRRWMPND